MFTATVWWRVERRYRQVGENEIRVAPQLSATRISFS